MCKGTTRFSLSDKRSRARTGRETGGNVGHITSKEMSKTTVDKPFVENKGERWEGVRVKRMQGAKDKEVLTPRKNVKEVEEEMPRGIR